MLSVRFHDLAKAELNDAIHFFKQVAGPEIAHQWLDEALRKIKKCASNPLIYKTVYGEARRANFTHFREYYLAFLLHNDCIYILAVAHAKRKPYYWKNRLNDVTNS